MRKAFLLAAGFLVFATGAWAQESSRDRDDFDRGGWRENRESWDRDRDRRRSQMMMREDRDDSDRSERGARFFLRSGDTQLRIVCGNRESTQSCRGPRAAPSVRDQEGAAGDHQEQERHDADHDVEEEPGRQEEAVVLVEVAKACRSGAAAAVGRDASGPGARRGPARPGPPLPARRLPAAASRGNPSSFPRFGTRAPRTRRAGPVSATRTFA